MKDRWLKAAFSDDNLVAELLLRLQQPPPPSLSWGHKQQRSTPSRKNSSSSTRFSPRTPLSWSDGGCDDSTVSCAKSQPFPASRSKLKLEESELLSERVNLKRDLKSIHVNLEGHRIESDYLKKIKFDLNQQSTEVGALSTEPEVIFANHHSKMEASTASLHQSILPRHAIKEERGLANSCGMQEVAETNKRGFVVPDLNMPVGDDETSAELW